MANYAETMPRDVIVKLNRYKQEIQNLINNIVSGELTDKELSSSEEAIKILQKEYRKLRSRHDRLYFAYEYFSEDRNPGNKGNIIPADSSIDDAPKFHSELCNLLNTLAINPVQKICWSAPRGHAKSAYLSNVTPVHSIIFELHRFILVISNEVGLAQDLIKWGNQQLKFNEKLREDFGDFLNPNKMANIKDNEELYITSNNIMVKASSTGKQLRGSRHGSYRPDLVILDDLESSDNTNTPELRAKNLHWFNSVIEPIGDPTRTTFIYMGTLVHGKGLLPAVMAKPDFKSKQYSAIVSEPVRGDLWEQYEDILRDQTNPERLDDADAFYAENREEMDRGVETLWKRFSYSDLIKKKISLGTRAFYSEYLNKPSDLETAIFKEDIITYYDDKDLFNNDGSPVYMDIYGFFDMAVGRTERADYNAVIMLGRDPRTGILYVLEAFIQKLPIHKAKEECIRLIKKWKPRRFGIETVQMQFEIYRQIQEQLRRDGHYITAIEAITPKGNKESRIEMLEPLVENGTIRFKKQHRILLEQLTQFPNCENDDGVDALQQAVNIASSGVRKTYRNKPRGF